MSTERLLRRGTTAEINAMTPTDGETVYNTTTDRLHNGDGSTAGGIPIPIVKDIQDGLFVYGAAGGTANALTVTTSLTPAALVTGQEVLIKIASNNSGAATLNRDGKGVTNIKKDDGSGSKVDLELDDLKAGFFVNFVYDGTDYIAQISAAGGGGLVLLGVIAGSSGATLNFTSMMDSSLYSSYTMVIDKLAGSSSTLWIRYSINNGVSWISGANTYESSQNSTTVLGTTDTSWSMTADTNKTYIKLATILGHGVVGVFEFTGMDGGSTGGKGTRESNHLAGNYRDRNGAFYTIVGWGDDATAFAGDIDAIQVGNTAAVTYASGNVYLYGRVRA